MFWKLENIFPMREVGTDWKSQGILTKLLEKMSEFYQKYWKSEENLDFLIEVYKFVK